MQSGNGLRGFKCLPCRVTLRRRLVTIEGITAKSKYLDTSMTVVAAQARVVGCSFVTEMFVIRQMQVMFKITRVIKHRFENATTGERFKCPVKLVGQICWGKMDFAIGGIRTR